MSSPSQLLAQAPQICVLVLRETLDGDMVHAGRKTRDIPGFAPP
jgi:hypothetical protein